MKKYIILIIITIITIISCKAQSPIISIEDDSNNDDFTAENAYVKDINNKFNPFFGEWKWEDTATNTSFTIVFSKIEMVYDGDYYEDVLIGKYRFIKNGVELFNSLNLTGVNATTLGNGSIWGKLIYSSVYDSDNEISFSIYDNIKNKYCRSQVTLLTPILTDFNGMNIVQVGAQLRWRLRFGEGPFIDEQFSPYDYFSLPANVILIKQ